MPLVGPCLNCVTQLTKFLYAWHAQHYFHHFYNNSEQPYCIPQHNVCFIGQNTNHGDERNNNKDAVENVSQEQVAGHTFFVVFAFRMLQTIQYVCVVVG